MFFRICLFAIMFLSNSAFAQITVSIGASSTTVNTYFPIYTYFSYNYSQQIYTASEMSAGGAITGGQITQIKFKAGPTVNANTNFNSWVVYLGNTTLGNFSSTSNWIPVSSMTQVFSGNITALTANGWMTLNLTTPFTWNGGNIVVAVDENTINWTNPQDWYSFTTTSATGPRGILYYSDATNPSPSSPPTANYSSTDTRSQIQFTMLGCSGAPNTGIASASVSTTCPNVNFTLSATGLTSNVSVPGISYQWQVSTNGGSTWSNIAGATSSSLIRSQTVASSYRIRTSCSFSGLTSTSSSVAVGLFSTPVGGSASANQIICSGNTPSNITVTGYTSGASIQWQWSNNGTSGWTNLIGATSALLQGSFIVSSLGPLNSAKYFRAQISNTCTTNNIAYSTNHLITVNPVPTVTVAPSQSICSGNSLNLNAVSTINPASFSWSPTAGLSNPNSANPVASPANTTTYTVQVTTPVGCVKTTSTTITVNPTPVVTTGGNQSICNGSAVVLNASSSVSPATFSWSPSTGLSAANIPNPTAAPSSTVTYTVQATSSFGCIGTANSTVSVIPFLNAGTVTPNIQTICINGTPQALTLTGSNGNVAWQCSADNINWSNIGAASTTTLTPANMASANCGGAFTSSRYFRAVVSLTNCSTVIASAAQVVVGQPIAGSISSNQSICSGGVPGTIILSGSSGNIQWEWSSNGTTGWTSIPGATSATLTGSYIGTLSATRYFRARLSYPQCSYAVLSSLHTVSVNPTPQINAGPNQQICIGDSVVLSATPSTNITWNNNVTNGAYFFPQSTASYVVSTTNANNCVGRDTVIVTVGYPGDTIINASSLGPYALNGITYSQSGTYVQNTNTTLGCDSTITLNLIYYGTGIDESDTSPLLLVIPNPSSDGVFELVLQNAAVSDVMYIRVYDQTGRVVFDSARAVERIDLSNHGNGMYLLEVGLPQGRAMQKLALLR